MSAPTAMPPPTSTDAPFTVHLLDVGQERYGDCLLCRFGATSVLIDGAHPGDTHPASGHAPIADQLRGLLQQTGTPLRVSLLVVTHAHSDHIGCLPALVQNGLLAADYALVADPDLGWGREASAAPAPTHDALPPAVQRLTGALREEPRPDTTDAEINQFVSDAAGLEADYRAMLVKLTHDGTKVVRYGQDNHDALVAQFANVGLNILGPSPTQLLLCAEAISQAGSRTEDALQTGLSGDAPLSPQSEATLYRQLVGDSSGTDAASGGTGAAINNQSLTLRFAYGGRKLLFSGDMQLADPQTPRVSGEITALRARIRQDGPFDWAKIGHHGSTNAFDAAFLTETGAKVFGICTGQDSPGHPSQPTLTVLAANTNAIQWARTDHNGQTTFTFGPTGIAIAPSRNALNDAVLNPVRAADIETGSGQPASNTGQQIVAPVASTGTALNTLTAAAFVPTEQSRSPQSVAVSPVALPPGGDSGFIEIVARIPNGATRVTITVDVQPQPSPVPMPQRDAPPVIAPLTPTKPLPSAPPLNIAGGRRLPPLLFVTSRAALSRNIGISETGLVLDSLRHAGHVVCDSLPDGLGNAVNAAPLIRTALMQAPHVEGIVILGGYDIVPPQRLDVLDARLRQQLMASVDYYSVHDADNFVVWSDALYGAKTADGLPDVPVSRIPDGKSSALVFAALQAGRATAPATRAGVRNYARPFADMVYDTLRTSDAIPLGGPTPMLTSGAIVHSDFPPHSLDGDYLYLMLHGAAQDGTGFWGEQANANPVVYTEALKLHSVPDSGPDVIFSGCCWGGLAGTLPASLVADGQAPVGRQLDDSLALHFLHSGARAFVGCTGSHYSPTEAPYDYYGKPLHQAFWQTLIAGNPPARALLLAKTQYLAGIPHTPARNRPIDVAIELKNLRQATCLGLGW